MTSDVSRARYRFKVQPLNDRDETAILVFRDWCVEGRSTYPVGTEVLTIDDGWIPVIEGVHLPMDKIPRISGIDMWHEGRMLNILDDWEQHIRAAIKADTGIEVSPI